MRLSIRSKRWLLTVHILFAAIMFGNMATFLILSIATAITADVQVIRACYTVMHILASTSVKASTIGTAITGILLSIWTKWGLFRFYWIIVKEALTIFLFVLNLWGMYAWTNNALALSATGNRADKFMMHLDLWTGISMQIISLILIFALSVFKPWGRFMVSK